MNPKKGVRPGKMRLLFLAVDPGSTRAWNCAYKARGSAFEVSVPQAPEVRNRAPSVGS